MIKLLALTEDLNSGASIPRVHSLENLTETGHNVHVKVKTTTVPLESFEVDWCDILYIHRPIYASLLQTLQYAKANGKKVWVDNDDDQLSLPMDHPKYIFYLNEELRTSIKEITKLADFVTYSNAQILKTYGELNSNYEVIPCAYPDYLFAKPNLEPRAKTVSWRGCYHDKSLHEYSDAIVEVANEFPDWRFIFIGAMPWHIIERIKNPWHAWSDFLTPRQMWAVMKTEKPAIHMVPLTDNQFTRSRSNMAYLDATIAGALTLAPLWDHWRCSGVIHYESKEEFNLRLSGLMHHYESGCFCKKDKKAAIEYIRENQTFSAINKTQIKIIEKLMGESK